MINCSKMPCTWKPRLQENKLCACTISHVFQKYLSAHRAAAPISHYRDDSCHNHTVNSCSKKKKKKNLFFFFAVFIVTVLQSSSTEASTCCHWNIFILACCLMAKHRSRWRSYENWGLSPLVSSHISRSSTLRMLAAVYWLVLYDVIAVYTVDRHDNNCFSTQVQ